MLVTTPLEVWLFFLIKPINQGITMDNLFLLLLVVIAFMPVVIIGALIEHYLKSVQKARGDKLARERREYVEQNLMR